MNKLQGAMLIGFSKQIVNRTKKYQKIWPCVLKQCRPLFEQSFSIAENDRNAIVLYFLMCQIKCELLKTNTFSGLFSF